MFKAFFKLNLMSNFKIKDNKKKKKGCKIFNNFG